MEDVYTAATCTTPGLTTTDTGQHGGCSVLPGRRTATGWPAPGGTNGLFPVLGRGSTLCTTTAHSRVPCTRE